MTYAPTVANARMATKYTPAATASAADGVSLGPGTRGSMPTLSTPNVSVKPASATQRTHTDQPSRGPLGERVPKTGRSSQLILAAAGPGASLHPAALQQLLQPGCIRLEVESAAEGHRAVRLSVSSTGRSIWTLYSELAIAPSLLPRRPRSVTKPEVGR